MKYLLSLLYCFSCLATADYRWFEHKIIVPEEFSNGRNSEVFVGRSDIERYIGNFDSTWWKVMRAYGTGGDWKAIEFSICSGTAAASYGCADGYQSAVNHLRKCIELHGEEAVREAIMERLNP